MATCIECVHFEVFLTQYFFEPVASEDSNLTAVVTSESPGGMKQFLLAVDFSDGMHRVKDVSHVNAAAFALDL